MSVSIGHIVDIRHNSLILKDGDGTVIGTELMIASAGKIRCEYCVEPFGVREAPKRRTGSSVVA